MDDSDLLEFAGRAAGVQYTSQNNPLEDDALALRLAVRLRLEIDIHHTGIAIRTPNGIKVLVGAEDEPDANAATRRAIVRAAAEIGRAA